ncbi:thyroid adenoma-associated protein isoform X2 [Clupea harengus]|uniref:tRNA (32-2'-O)-methyltransferase regulator THADA n=1 Tax=Clupea harengus TaxID=7950 RepID=A0A6P8GK50_CLUHA|nr:thyroid adenoma-associated protein isoform X2 [Clupea harengus]
MVVKKKTAKVEAVVLDDAKLERLRTSLAAEGNATDTDLAQTLLECLGLTDPVQQIQLIKKAGAMLEDTPQPDNSPSPAPLLQASVEALCVMFISVQAKNPLKRATASALGSVPEWLQEQTAVCLSVALSDGLSSLGSEHYTNLTDTVTSCLDRFPIGERCIQILQTDVLQFFQKALSEHLNLNRTLSGRHVVQAQLMYSCLGAVKASMLVLQRTQKLLGVGLKTTGSECPLQRALSGLMNCYTHILTDEEFIQSVQSTAGMAVVLLIRSVTENEEDVAKEVAGLLQCTQQRDLESAPSWLRESSAGLYEAGRPAALVVYLCHGALAMLSWKGWSLGPQAEALLLLIPHAILDLDTSVKESSTAMVVARILTLWSGAALEALQGATQPPLLSPAVRGDAALTSRLLEHVYAHWEHPLDGVRHQTRSLFRNLLSLHQASAGLENDNRALTSSPLTSDPYIMRLTQGLLALEWHMRGKYGSLACLVEHMGAGYLLTLEPLLPTRLLGLMGDQTLAPYASDLLERLFISHKAQLSEGEAGETAGSPEAWMEEWHRIWVRPLLEVLCKAKLDQTTYILDYFLPKLLRCNPPSLSHMVQALQETPPTAAGPVGSRGAVGALMTCLRAARAQGVMRPSEERLWGGLVPLPLLRHALLHKHDQVRMDTLGLVCESHRSTETTSPQEMDLIRCFLPSNLNGQSPGVRQQTVSLIKKLLCRLKDSAQLLQRRVAQEKVPQQKEKDQHILHSYKEFLCWLCETLFGSLAPGASFSTCIMSLHLLGLVAELLSFSTGPDGFALGECVSETHADSVLFCLASNFLEVKQLASVLIRSLPHKVVRLEDPDRLHSLLEASLALSTSTRPFDSVTAAHLLNLLLHQPHLQPALLLCGQQQGILLQPPHPGEPQASEQASTLERNTFALVQFLLECLKAEVAQAELSLLQAAAVRPLYGRAHCISAAIQQLNTGSLVLASQWRCLVPELVAVCYRMSDVVSPVVQSSSPEGLIPMDTDSEASAGLQRILQEIQPRDTNDFFNDSRQLDTHSEEPHTPEGPIQEETRGSGGEAYRVTAQMVLVCCWRSMKEVSMLLGELCQSLPLHTHTSHGLITEEQVEGVGQYFREQLLQSRHRGAFELAYVGFVQLTDMLCRSGSKTLQQLPAHWLKEVLGEVRSSDPSSKLCATRRSAGIPFYIQALLSSEPKLSSCSLLKMTMKELTALAMPTQGTATDASTVPQVHALNILRALYRDTRLGENIVPFVADGLQAAVLGFTSPIWAVRNSSTLLFSTLITRIFGVKKGKDEHSKKNRMTGREFFTRFPALYPFLLGQLEEAAGSVDSDSGQVKLHPSLFLLLLVLGRLYPSPMDGSASPLGLAAFMPFIIRCGCSAVYRTREMAARALVPFVLVTQIPATVQNLLEQLPPQPGPENQQNHIHGTLLQVLFLLRSYHSDSMKPQLGADITVALHQRLWLASRRNPCLVTRAVCLDLLGCVCSPDFGFEEDTQLQSLRDEIISLLVASELGTPGCRGEDSLSAPGYVQYLQSFARLASRVCVAPEITKDPRGPQLFGRLLQCPHYEVRELALEALLKKMKAEEDTEGEECHTLNCDPDVRMLCRMAMHETHLPCLAKVLQVLSVLPLSSLLPWTDGHVTLPDQQALEHILKLAQKHTHSVDLYCASLTLASRLVVHLVENASQELDASAVACLGLWGALVRQGCMEDQPSEVKLITADMLVETTPSLLTSSTLPLGISHTVASWQSLFTLLQDEEQAVRDRASHCICSIPQDLLNAVHTDVAAGAVCPPVALRLGVALLCQLFQVWDQVSVGVTTLTEWLLGDSSLDVSAEDDTDVDEFLFEKGDLNLWAEPLQWARLLHTHLASLASAVGAGGIAPAELHRLSEMAQKQARSSERALGALPALPEFSANLEHARLSVQRERAALALRVLGKLQKDSLSS